jgi:RNA polymerase sigma-70 factor (ECF subfamily)
MMASIPAPGKIDPQQLTATELFAAEHYGLSEAERFGIHAARLGSILEEVVRQYSSVADKIGIPQFLASLRLQELVLARACMEGNELAWELFLTRYRTTLYETAYKVAGEDSAARALADSLYAELYGVNDKGEQRISKLRYYQGRGSLQGWLRTVVAQEYVNRYRRIRRETSLEAAVEEGKQFAAAASGLSVVDPRVKTATTAELAALPVEERFLFAAYYLDRHTLAEIAKLMRVHESTVSRKLEKATIGLRKRIRKRLMQAGMSSRQADEAMQDIDVRDLQVPVAETIRQGTPEAAFYPKKSGDEG